ncbi:MAG TPA: AmmeMemoRadiSam system protein A [Treponemataceae bacterium]|nr:AmmeMemoRadiSam system protein A [Treponemataceae bacterium]
MPILGTCMVPHPPLIAGSVGRGKEQKAKKTIEAFHKEAKRIALLKPQTIIISSPHAPLYADYFHISPGKAGYGDFYQFGDESTSISCAYDEEFVRNLENLCKAQGFPAGTLGTKTDILDHGTMVPLYFINQYYTDYELVRIGLSSLSYFEHYKLGQLIAYTSTLLGRSVYYVASGDLSHKLLPEGPYGFAEEGPVYDERLMEAMSRGDFLSLFDFSEDFCEAAAECGHRSFCIMAGFLDRTRVVSEKLSYEGPFGVGYGICAFSPVEEDDSRNYLEQAIQNEREKTSTFRKNEDAYVSLARQSLEYFVTHGSVMEIPEHIDAELSGQKAGVFVSLKKHGKLRGCIGTISPVHESTAAEIIHNAVSSASLDHRFNPVTKEELIDLVYSVDVLGPIEKIDGEDELDPKQYGVIVSCGMKRGLLLPNLEGVDTVEQQIDIARRKAGISPVEKTRLERFEVIRHT